MNPFDKLRAELAAEKARADKAEAAVARALRCEIKPEHFRALAVAAFADMKYWRFLGGFKDDHLIDGINYDAFLAEEMRQLIGELK